LIRKCVEAKNHALPSITVWGTGRATREFLYVEDAAEGIIAATEAYSKTDPVNLGSGGEISIRQLVDLIKEEVGYTGSVEWDDTKPDGQPRRCLDTTKAFEEFGWRSKTSFREGIKKTIRWFLSQ
jgi:GDP-L-fucose synthase